jgi:hypothetical protein
MKNFCSLRRLLQITRVDDFTQKRQLGDGKLDSRTVRILPSVARVGKYAVQSLLEQAGSGIPMHNL